MNKQHCQNCQHYLQHYILKDGALARIYCGHCVFSHAKRKRPNTPACEHFAPGVPDTDPFVTKEYLTRELLHHILNLELLPKIEDLPVQSGKRSRG